MRLTLNDVAKSLERIFALVNPTPDQAQIYSKLILEAFGWMDPQRFDLVTIDLVREMKNGRPPVPAQFTAVYRKLDERYGWTAKDKATKIKCHSCAGTGLVYQTLIKDDASMVDQFVRPCPECRRGHKYADAPIRPGWIPAENSGFEMPTESTVRFIRNTFDVNLDFTKPPAQVFGDFMEIWRKGPLKTLKGGVFGQLLGPLRPREKEETLPAKVNSVPPAVAHIPEERRKELEQMAIEEDIPF